VLDPGYLHGASPELDKRIQAQLGAANVTERLFGHDDLTEIPISLSTVLDAIEADYQLARSEKSRQAPLFLAALADAARAAGLVGRAERAYLEFQSIQPDSAYGFRDIGTLYRDQGHLVEAQTMLERAVQISPRDVASRFNLMLVYLDQGMWVEAEQELDVIFKQSLITPFRSRLFDPDLYVARATIYLAQGDLAQALSARRQVAVIRGLPDDYLTLADLYRQLDQPQQATEQCTKAAVALFGTWPRPLDPQLWDIGVCLAEAKGDLPKAITALSRGHPLVGNVLLGHVYRARGQLDEARAAYQRAADARTDEGAPHYFLGETYQALGQAEKAGAAYRQAVQLDPLESLPLLALGKMQWGQGEREAALGSLQAAVEVTPGWGPAQVALGNALLAMDDREGAGRHYRLAQVADGDVHEGLIYDLAAHLAEAKIQSPGPDYVRNDHFTVNGDQRRVIFMHPDARVSYRLALPATHAMPGRTVGGLSLAFDVATAPESWGQPGDGVAFAVSVESSGGTEQVFSTYIDPKGNEADQDWHAYAVDLSAYAGQTVTLVFETGSGPLGDGRFDWAGWGRPRLLAP
jgi:tetratricopeptide (TPR) repeat protein